MTASQVWTLGDEIRKARTSAPMDQQTLAAALGVSRQLISKWERNIGEPTVSQWRKIAEVTGARWLLGGTEGDSPVFLPGPSDQPGQVRQMRLRLEIDPPPVLLNDRRARPCRRRLSHDVPWLLLQAS